MNASASALPREHEVQSKIRKVRKFGRIARFVCAACFGFGLVGSLFLLLILVPTQTPKLMDNGGFNGGSYDLLTALLTPLQFKVCMFLAMSMLTSIWLAAVYQLYRLFGDLAVGAIYTPENVRRIRHVGLLFLLLTVLVNIVVPGALIAAHGLIDPSIPIDLDRILPRLRELFGDFISPGLILLASWIMDVGLYEKDHADALKREADLVI